MSDGIRKRSVATAAVIAAVVVVVAVVVVGDLWANREADAAIPVACTDAYSLLDAGLLDDAAVSFAKLERVAHGRTCCRPGRRGSDCAPIPPVPPVADRRSTAARYSARAQAYWQAVELQHVPPDSDARERALDRATRALVASLKLDPFNDEDRAELTALVGALAAPRTRDEANAMCRTANDVRNTHLLDDAEAMYARALRSGHNTACLRSGLGLIRGEEAAARSALLNAATNERRGHKAAARKDYLTALSNDASLTQARTALGRLPAPNAARSTGLGLATSTAGDGFGWVSGSIETVSKHLAATIVVLVAIIVLGWLAMLIALASSSFEPVRRLMMKVPPLQRFARTRTRVATFTPEDRGWSCGSVFAEYLPKDAVDTGAQRPEVATIDRFESVTGDSTIDFASVIAAVPSAAPLAAAASWFREKAPRREARLFGQILAGGAQRFGLRVIIVSRGGKTVGSRTFWSSELPGPPFTDEEAARTALAILAAAWAHETIG